MGERGALGWRIGRWQRSEKIDAKGSIGSLLNLAGGLLNLFGRQIGRTEKTNSTCLADGGDASIDLALGGERTLLAARDAERKSCHAQSSTCLMEGYSS